MTDQQRTGCQHRCFALTAFPSKQNKECSGYKHWRKTTFRLNQTKDEIHIIKDQVKLPKNKDKKSTPELVTVA